MSNNNSTFLRGSKINQQTSQLLKKVTAQIANEQQLQLSPFLTKYLVDQFEKKIEQTRKLIIERKSCMPELKQELQTLKKLTIEHIDKILNTIIKIQFEEFNTKILSEANDERDIKYLFQYEPLLSQFQCFLADQKSQLRIVQKCVKKLEGDSISYKAIEQLDCDQICNAISFNQSNSIMVQGLAEKIKVWNFKNGQLYDSRILQGHTSNIWVLNFANTQNMFVSGSGDYTIKIWKEFQVNDWKNTQTLLGHTGSIHCVIFNKDDTQLISSSADQLIKVWCLDYDKWLCSQTLDNHQNQVYQLCFNESSTQFLSCSYDKYLIIWQIDLSKQWVKFQSIKNQSYSYRACFIQDNQIAVQQNGRRYVDFFTKCNNQFVKTQEVELSYLNTDFYLFCPFQFRKNKQLLLVKHNKTVYVLRRKRNWRFQIEESIECDANGSLTNDGTYLILWDKEKRKLKIFQQQLQ